MNTDYGHTNKNPEKPRLVVLDPGLQHESGHHSTLISLFVSQEFYCENLVTILAHNEIVPALLKRYKKNGQIQPFFTSHFYELHESSASLAEASKYIVKLTSEYREAFNRFKNEPCMFLYPSIDWEHAVALAHAIEGFNCFFPEAKHTHKVCLMFNPGMNYCDNTVNSRKWVNYRIGFNTLAQLDRVEFFASDYEMAEKYQQLLGRANPIPIHPCYLEDWRVRDTLPEIQDNKLSIGLYAGDAKESKGFHKLPSILKTLLKSMPVESTVSIQFTHEGNSSEINSTVSNLWEIQSSDNRVRIYDRYLSEEQLRDYLHELNFFIFTYCPKVYGEKTSGFLWLSVWYRCHMLCTDESWITREAKRLGVKAPIMAAEKMVAYMINKKEETMDANWFNLENNEYARKLFKPFIPWLIEDIGSSINAYGRKR